MMKYRLMELSLTLLTMGILLLISWWMAIKDKKKKLRDEFIRDKYIPNIIGNVLKKYKPTTNKEFIEFSQALYDQVKSKEKLLNIKNLL